MCRKLCTHVQAAVQEAVQEAVLASVQEAVLASVQEAVLASAAHCTVHKTFAADAAVLSRKQSFLGRATGTICCKV
jgi:hypothetical protein